MEWWEILLGGIFLLGTGIFILLFCGAMGWFAFFRFPSMLIYCELLPHTIKVVKKRRDKYLTDKEIKSRRERNERLAYQRQRLRRLSLVETIKEDEKRILDDELAQGKITESEHQQKLAMLEAATEISRKAL